MCTRCIDCKLSLGDLVHADFQQMRRMLLISWKGFDRCIFGGGFPMEASWAIFLSPSPDGRSMI